MAGEEFLAQVDCLPEEEWTGKDDQDWDEDWDQEWDEDWDKEWDEDWEKEEMTRDEMAQWFIEHVSANCYDFKQEAYEALEMAEKYDDEEFEMAGEAFLMEKDCMPEDDWTGKDSEEWSREEGEMWFIEHVAYNCPTFKQDAYDFIEQGKQYTDDEIEMAGEAFLM
jgi:hypothetical protein